MKFKKYDIPEPIESSRLIGNNKKNILVVISSSYEEILNDEGHLLNKIMAAVSVDVKEDIHLLQLKAGEEIQIQGLLNQKDYQKIILFGVTCKQVSIQADIPLYQLSRIQNIELLAAHSIEDIGNKQEFKKSLWSALQILFPK